MVNSSQPRNDTEPAVADDGKQVKDCKRDGESSPESKQDCHNVVKSSGLGTKRRFCCEHGHKTKSHKVNVACQTDDTPGGGGGTATVDSTKNSSAAAFDSAVFNNPLDPALSPATALRVSAPQTSPKQDGDEGSKSEGTLRLMIHNFRNMNDTVRGPAKIVNNIPWKIMVMPRQHVVAKKGTQKCLGFFLQCFPESYSDSWSCQAAAELRLISQKPGAPNFVRKTNHVYTAKENDWGYSCFMTWADILDESQGYMKDENVILEVYVKAEAPKGILTHDQFCKKIQDYMRLADMQCSRNLIDKALEVNQTALKFCKDKDETMKDELERQRARLIEQKLKQSIERIEKGFSDTKITENGEPTLRQAITGNLPAMKNAGGANTGTKISSSVPTSKDKVVPVNKQAKDGAKTGLTTLQQPPSSEDVKLNVDGTNENKRGANKGQLKSQQVVDMDDPEAGTSDESDDDSDYEDIDEVCDSCLVEKLENMSCSGGNGVSVGTDSPGAVETQENGCQTEPPVAKPRLPPVGASVDDGKGRPMANNSSLVNSTKVENEPGHQQPTKNQTQGKTTSSTGSIGTLSSNNDSEQKLLQLITEESKASLNTIKDTLERLVLLAQGGDTTLPNNVHFELDHVKSTATIPIAKTNTQNAGSENVKTDIVEIPAPPAADGQQQHVEEHAKLVTISNQLVAHRRRQQQEQLENIIAEELNDTLLQDAIQRQQQRQHQQFVQTDLSFTPRAGSPTEDRTLLARAQAIVENKAEELVTKYSQLIEQSEANRLAETVKKVEKRMKDIEKQTMTCRKELSDECERHYREEQKLIKANKQLKQQLDQANEKIEKLNNQLKDKRMEVKKLEKRLKAECQSSAENAELNNKIEQLERDLSACRQKHSDEKQRWNDEMQKFHETKRSLQQELTFTTGEVERLHTQLEEKNAHVRKLEASLKQERQQTQSTLKESTERAKKAEINLLELRLEVGLKSLQRALDECQSHVAQLEDAAKRFTRMQMNDEARTCSNCLQEWRKTRDKIQDVIQKAKSECGQQIDAIKAGKPLATLPALEIPRPPPPPATPKLLLSVQTPPEQRQQHIAPIGTAAAVTKGAGVSCATTQSSQLPQSLSSSQSQHVPNSSGGSGAPNNTSQRAPSVPPSLGICNGPANQGQSTAYPGTTVPSATSQTPAAPALALSTTDATGGTTPSSFDQLGFAPGGTAVSSSGGGGPSGFSAAVPVSSLSQSMSSAGREKMPFEVGGVSDFTPWGNDPLNVMHTLIGTKGGFNIAGFDGGFNISSPSSSLAPTSTISTSGQSGSHELMNGGYGTTTCGGSGTPSGRQSQDGQQPGHWSNHPQHQHHHWAQQSPALRSSASSRSQANRTPPQVFDGRSDSPNDKRLEALSEQLRNIFPNLSPDFIRDCINELRHYGKNFKSVPLDQLLNAAVGLVLSRQQQVPKMGTWSSSSIPSTVGGAYEGGGHGATTNASALMGDPNIGSNEELCAICGYALRLQPMCSLPSCSHVFHSACAAQWLLGQRACPTCGVFALPPEEYPDLS